MSGLRTLVFGVRELDAQVYQSLLGELKDAQCLIGSERTRALDQVSAKIESDIALIGVSGVEDKLQPGVKKCLQSLISAGIQVRVLSYSPQFPGSSPPLYHLHHFFSLLLLLQALLLLLLILVLLLHFLDLLLPFLLILLHCYHDLQLLLLRNPFVTSLPSSSPSNTSKISCFFFKPSTTSSSTHRSPHIVYLYWMNSSFALGMGVDG